MSIALLAIITLKKILSGVKSSYVISKIAFVTKAFLAIVTLIRFLFSMTSDVICEMAFLTKPLLTKLTLIRFLFGVNSDVRCKLATLTKGFLAIITPIQFFVGVSSYVTHKLTIVSIAFLAIFTFIKYVPGFQSDMILQPLMVNPLLFTITLVKRKATVPLSPHKLILMSQHMNIKFVKTSKVHVTKLTDKWSKKFDLHLCASVFLLIYFKYSWSIHS